MKKRLAIICCIALVALSLFTLLAACNKEAEMDDTGLKYARSALYTAYKDYNNTESNANYTVMATISTNDKDGKPVDVAIKWTITGTNQVKVSSKATDGNYTVTIPDRSKLTDDINYTLVATLVNGKGEAYKGYNGNKNATYTVEFNRTVTMMRSSDPNVVMTFTGSNGITDRGDTYTSTGDNPQTGFEYVTWNVDGLTLKYSRNTSTSPCMDPINNAARFYKYTKLEFSYTGTFKALRITISEANYATGFDSLSISGATIKREGMTVIISFANAVNSFTINSMGAQTRVSKIELFENFVPTFGEAVEGSVDAILTALENLPNGSTLDGGSYTLTGTITKIVTAYSESYGNITVNMLVKGETKELEIQCYRMAGGYGLAVDDEITVTGILKNFNGTLEFDAGCTYKKDGEVGNTPSGFTAITTPQAGTYKMAIWQPNLAGGKYIYMNGSMNGYYFASGDASAAVDIVLEQSGSGWTMKLANSGKYIRMYPRDGSTAASPSSSLEFSTDPCVWTWNDTLKAFYVTIDGTNFYLGTFNNNNTFSGSKESYFTQENPNFLAHLGTIA